MEIAPLATVPEPERAAILLHPLRLEIVRQARQPASATEIADRLGLPRQRVNYHVRRLADAGFLVPAERRRRGNLLELRYRATAHSWSISPRAVGDLAPDPDTFDDRVSAGYLQALAGRLQAELERLQELAGDRRVATLSLNADIRFEDAAQRAAFAAELERAITQVIARHTSPDRRPDGSPGRGRPFRLVLGCHPVPPPPTHP